MARTPFKLKSGNSMAGSSFKMMGSSPLREDEWTGKGLVPKTSEDPKFKTYQATLAAVTGDMTDQELRNMAKAQHIDPTTGKPSGKSKWNISYNALKNARLRAQRPKIESKEVVKEEVAEEPVVEEKVTPPVVEKKELLSYLKSHPETHVPPKAVTKVGDW